MGKGITREGIVAAALTVLDERGIEGVTVRAVAAELNVKAPALYHHVSSKQDLLDEMGTEVQRRVVHAVVSRPPASNWLDDLVAYGRALRAEYLQHRDGARTFSGTLITDPEVLRAGEPLLRCWGTAGVSLTDAADAVDFITSFVVGFVIEEQERLQSANVDPTRYSPHERAQRVGEDAPLVAQAGHARRDSSARFERLLHVAITGLATSLSTASVLSPSGPMEDDLSSEDGQIKFDS